MCLLPHRRAARLRVLRPYALHVLNYCISLHLCVPRLVHRRLGVLRVGKLEVAHLVVLGGEGAVLLRDVAVPFACWGVDFAGIRAYGHSGYLILRIDILH